MIKWFRNSASGQVFDVAADDTTAIRYAVQNGAVEIDPPVEEESTDDKSSADGEKGNSRKKKGGASDKEPVPPEGDDA